ncbi:unnamed protein product [Lactuca saligna]|uniref:RRM domain-containing protein n=1 Tax=Lactuca saligna TaxID=75948 RepID=A0AA35VPH3_LACSI|nr:unnamed protein product [Lactuca saligna]
MAIGEWTEVRQRRRRHQEDHNLTKSMATSFFFQNFPEDWDEKALWQTFQRYGTIVDLYLARKRNIKNKRFGFVRFIRIENISEFERKLNGIWIGNYKLRVNLARFQRKSTANLRSTMPPNGHGQTKQPYGYPHLHSFQPNNQDAQKCTKSYAEVVAGDKLPKETTNPTPIRMTSFEETREFMKRALVGKVENFQALMNVRAFPEVEECPTVVMRYLGGLKMLVEFESEAAKSKFLVDGRQIWKPWFKTMYNWNPKENFNVRIASIMIFGVPQHAWCEEAFSVIARKWGTVIIPEECATDNPSMVFGRVGILTSHPNLINQSITISVDESPFSITVLEDLLESTRLSPVVASNEFALSPNSSPKWFENPYWEDLHESSVEDIAEEGEINSSDDEDFVCSPVQDTNNRFLSKSPVIHSREDKEKSPVNNNCSHNSQGSPRNPRSPDAAREENKEPLDHMGNFSPQSLQNSGSLQNNTTIGKEAQSKSPNGPTQEGSTSLISPRQKSPVGIEKSNTEDEVSQTIEIGERIGFQVQGGVGCEVKRDWIKNIRRDNKVFLLGLQETKLVEIKGCLDRSIWGDSNFQCEVSDPVGLSGGIATIWNPNQFKLSEAIFGYGYLLTKGEWIPSKTEYSFVNVYAPNDPGRRKLLWAELENILNAHSNSRWVIFGDFNEVRSECERLGSSFCISSANHFNNFISNAGLIDLQMGGRRFTYMSSDGGKHSKLDRFLVSYNTIYEWPHLQVTVLPRLYSDHCPILLSSPICDYGPPPFRFFNSWLQDESLDKVVVVGWTFEPSIRFFASLSPISVVAGKLKNTKGKIKDWRKSKNVEANMKRQDLIEKINKIDLEAEGGVANPNLMELRKHLHKELLEIESKRISDLKQKARCKWALEGDENSEGGFNAPSRARRKGFCSGTIVNLHSDLSKLGIDLKNLFSIQSEGRFWKLGFSGIFTVASLRTHIDNNILPKSSNCWIWNHLVPRKVNILAWRVNHGRLPTKENLFNLGIGSNPLCTLCNQHAESESHLFTTCAVSLKVWSEVATWWHRFPPGFQSVKDLLHCKANVQSNGDFGLIHEAVALVFIWVIWSFRNKMAYSDKHISPSCLINDIQTLSYLWIKVRHKSKKLRWLEWCCNPIQEAGLN